MGIRFGLKTRCDRYSVLYRRASLVSVVISWPILNIAIIGVGHHMIAGTKDYWYRLY
jgi:hypothetical protein